VRFTNQIFIDTGKLTRYLLVKREKDDKSVFLNSAGYTLDSWRQLEEDLRKIASEHEAIFSHSSLYGDYYIIKATLEGPNGKKVRVHTVWMKEFFSDKVKFITLFPDKKIS